MKVLDLLNSKNKEDRDEAIKMLNSCAFTSQAFEKKMEESDDFFELHLCEYCDGSTELGTCRNCGASEMKTREAYITEKYSLVQMYGKKNYKWICNLDEELGKVA